MSASSGAGVPSGLPDLDRLTHGFRPGDLVILGGRPSMGKTALALDMVRHAAIEQGVPVAVFSLEMSRESLVQRLQCAEGHIEAGRLRRGRLRDDEYNRLELAAARLNAAPIWIDDTPANSPLQVRVTARRLKAEANLALLVVDYLQLMRPPGNVESRRRQISAASGVLRDVARDLDLTVIALSQLPLVVDRRKDKRPILADLRTFGATESSADIVAFLYREELYRKEGDLHDENGESIEGRTELIVAKNRRGPTGMVRLALNKSYVSFEPYCDPESASSGVSV